ncbi:hypothetical protein ANO11243_004610 [Dothideomycetidae sp. 11243]|nr:hypothetical protein ANO11243_004610 [fungal sp. No.11243]
MPIRARLTPAGAFSLVKKVNPSASSQREIHTTLSSTTSVWSLSRALVCTSKTSGIIRSQPSKLSVTAFSTSAQRSEATPIQTSTANRSATITWDEFLKLRRTRRYVNLVASLGTAVGSVAAAVPIAMQYELEDKIAAATGLDPFYALGIMITALGGFGWLMGPFVGNAGFLMWNRKIRGDIAKREREFYNHIKRFRADPTSSSVSNPVPDYYGEKITSVADYRRWLKDQRAFNRKKSKNMI